MSKPFSIPSGAPAHFLLSLSWDSEDECFLARVQAEGSSDSAVGRDDDDPGAAVRDALRRAGWERA
jgi:hypothetical protein